MISIPKCWSSGLAESRAEAGFTGLDMLAGKLNKDGAFSEVIGKGFTGEARDTPGLIGGILAGLLLSLCKKVMSRSCGALTRKGEGLEAVVHGLDSFNDLCMTSTESWAGGGGIMRGGEFPLSSFSSSDNLASVFNSELRLLNSGGQESPPCQRRPRSSGSRSLC